MITITHYRRELGWDRNALAFVDVPYEPEKTGYYLGYDKPNYPMPAIRRSTFDTLYNLGWVSALNGFDVDTVFNNHVKR